MQPLTPNPLFLRFSVPFNHAILYQLRNCLIIYLINLCFSSNSHTGQKLGNFIFGNSYLQTSADFFRMNLREPQAPAPHNTSPGHATSRRTAPALPEAPHGCPAPRSARPRTPGYHRRTGNCSFGGKCRCWSCPSPSHGSRHRLPPR